MSIHKEIAEYLYDLLVVNPYAAAIQMDDGNYITKYFDFSPFVIEEMLMQHGSMGCYQQGYKTNKIKWICFDFDCPDKKNPDVPNMYDKFVLPFVKKLDELTITYLTEFSGRRGIHVWIIFDSIISKKSGYTIVQELKKYAYNVFDSQEIHVDFYPATASSSGNIVGKQVKIPLSCHRSGGRSYLFDGSFSNISDCHSSFFLKGQLDILKNYKPNNYEKIEEMLQIEEKDAEIATYKYKRYNLVDNIDISLQEIEEILSETVVYKNIFSRMRLGCPKKEDWSVLLGTLTYLGNNHDIVQTLFSTFPNYDVQKTLQNIDKLSEKYFPATFGYLYELYMLEPENSLDPTETGLMYLLKKKGCENLISESVYRLNEKTNTKDIKYTVNKERNYLMDNDEVPDILIYNRLRNMKPYDFSLIEEKIECIKNGEWEQFTDPNELVIYKRCESEDRIRKMVSLSAYDRVLTTQLILSLQLKEREFWHSYSYNISPCSKDEIFYSWYSSWINYITKVRTYFDIPFLNSYNVFVMDLKRFYDNIDFLSVYKAYEQNLNPECKNIMQFLIAYNEKVMRIVNEDNSRKGVPQGPAYARVIAEMFLDYILQSIFKQYDKSKFSCYRYVDDIVVFYKPDFDGISMYKKMESTLLSFGLSLNQEKSKIFNSIKHLTNNEKNFIMHKDKFSYDLRKNETSVIFEEEQNKRIRKYLQNNEFDMSVVSYVFGNMVIKRASDVYYHKFSHLIYPESIGRGSYFKKFYYYLFKHSDLVEEALENGMFFKIPLDTLNFSNFIHCLYMVVSKEKISYELFDKIRNNYLKQIITKVCNDRDFGVVQALLLL